MSWKRGVTISSILKQANPFGQRRGPVNIGTIAIPFLGNATNYPFDNYSATGNWFVTPPTGMVVRSKESIRFVYIISPTVAATPDAGNLTWRWGSLPSIGDVIEANRTLSTQVFVSLIAVLPLLLFVGLLAAVWPITNNPERHRFPAELLVAVGAFLLAVIPVRTVLVPAEISQLTIVDYILGTEMAVMVAVSLMIVFAGSINLKSQSATPLAGPARP
jgi:hypothetical protein